MSPLVVDVGRQIQTLFLFIFLLKKKSQYIFMSMLCKNTYILLVLSDLADYK